MWTAAITAAAASLYAASAKAERANQAALNETTARLFGSAIARQRRGGCDYCGGGPFASRTCPGCGAPSQI